VQGVQRWGPDYGQIELRPSVPQKSKLLSQVFTLPLSLFPSPISGSRSVNQAQKLCFGCVLGLVHNCKLALKQGDLSSHLVNLPMSKSQ
jgi:hypothetical protein